MAKVTRIAATVLSIACAALAIALAVLAVLGGGHAGTRDGGTATAIDRATLEIDGGAREFSLPCTVHDLPGRTSASLSFACNPSAGDMLFLHTVYASYDVYADGVLIGSFGEEGTYPAFFADPPSAACSYGPLLPPSGKASDTVSVRIEFTSPIARDSLVLYEPVIGSEGLLASHLFTHYGLNFVLALLFIGIGLALAVMSAFFRSFENRGRELRCLGLFSLLAGLWQFSENTLSVFLVQAPSLMYLTAFIGMFALVLPLIRFAMEILHRRDSLFLRIEFFAMAGAVCLAFALQLLGAVPFSRSMYAFHVLIPLAITAISGYALYDALRHRNKGARLYFAASLFLAAGALLELANYYMRFVGQISQVFQISMLLFILASAFIALRFVRELHSQTLRNRELEAELGFLELSIEGQKERNALQLEHEKAIRELRHDLRHHLVSIRLMAATGDLDGLGSYVDALDESIPERRLKRHCENLVVDALIARYEEKAASCGAKFETRLQIPAAVPGIPDSDLCIVIGNLLENAVQACGEMEEGRDAFITINARIRGELLVIAVDNSFSGSLRESEGRFLTTKGEGHGIGLASVQTVASHHEGEARFEAPDNVFKASVYLRMHD